MDLSQYDLEGLGSHAHGHYKAGEKHKDKAEQQFKSAGLYLSEAKERLNTRKNPNAEMNFAEFLLRYCPIGKSRAYEVIAIADGRKTVEESRAANAAANQAYRERRDEASKFHHVMETQSSPPPRPQPEPHSDPVREAETIADNQRIQRISRVRTNLHRLTEEQLSQIERIMFNA